MRYHCKTIAKSKQNRGRQYKKQKITAAQIGDEEILKYKGLRKTRPLQVTSEIKITSI